MRLCKDGELSSSGFKYVTIENVAGEGGGSVTWVCADMGCGASVGIYFLCSCPMRGTRSVVRSDSPNDTVSHPGIPKSLNSNMADIHCQCYNILHNLHNSLLHAKQITSHVTLT